MKRPVPSLPLPSFLSSVLSSLLWSLLPACTSVAPTPEAVMNLPPGEVREVRQLASVPAAVAYRNILEAARRCWEDSDHVIDAESFHSSTDFAVMGLKKPERVFSPPLVLMAVEVSQATIDTSRITGRSLAAGGPHAGDLQNLRLWAEGKNIPCAGPQPQ